MQTSKPLSKQLENSINQLTREQKLALYENLQVQLFDKVPDNLPLNFKELIIGNYHSEFVEKIHHYLTKKPVVRAYLFGNFTKGENTIDLLLDFEQGVSHFEVLAVKEGLERILAASVQLASSRITLMILPKK
jgi:predicted nucleotidyltransferase